MYSKVPHEQDAMDLFNKQTVFKEHKSVNRDEYICL